MSDGVRRRGWVRGVALALAAVALAACTPSTRTPKRTVVRTETVTNGPGAIPTTPVAAGPTTTAAGDCPLVPLARAMDVIGQRLQRAAVQTSGGAVVGCEFYPDTTGPLARSEHLPTGGHPSARITVDTYPSAVSARQVLALVSTAARSPSLQPVDGLVGETFQTGFYPPDGTADWACAFVHGARLITVVLAEATSAGQGNAAELARAVAPRV